MIWLLFSAEENAWNSRRKITQLTHDISFRYRAPITRRWRALIEYFFPSLLIHQKECFKNESKHTNNLRSTFVPKKMVKQIWLKKPNLKGPNFGLIIWPISKKVSSFIFNGNTQIQTAPLLTSLNFIFTSIATSKQLALSLPIYLTSPHMNLKALINIFYRREVRKKYLEF